VAAGIVAAASAAAITAAAITRIVSLPSARRPRACRLARIVTYSPRPPS
jgi:hypothetical protein